MAKCINSTEIKMEHLWCCCKKEQIGNFKARELLGILVLNWYKKWSIFPNVHEIYTLSCEKIAYIWANKLGPVTFLLLSNYFQSLEFNHCNYTNSLRSPLPSTTPSLHIQIHRDMLISQRKFVIMKY